MTHQNNNRIVFTITLMLLLAIYINNDIATNGALRGIYIWYSSLIPALLPTLILLNIILSISNEKQNHIIIFLIILAGIPTNAKILSDMLTTKRISFKKYKFLLVLSSNPSLAFFTTYIFVMINKKYSLNPTLLFYPFFIVLISSFLTAIIFLIFNKETNSLSQQLHTKEVPIFSFNLLDRIISESVMTLMKILGYIVIFSTFSELLIIKGNSVIILLIRIFLEMSCGILLILDNFNIPTIFYPMICSLCAFGGVCGIFQTLSVIPKEHNITLFFIIKYKMLNALLAFSICYIINQIIF